MGVGGHEVAVAALVGEPEEDRRSNGAAQRIEQPVTPAENFGNQDDDAGRHEGEIGDEQGNEGDREHQRGGRRGLCSMLRRKTEVGEENDVEEGAGRQRGDGIADQDDGEADEVGDDTAHCESRPMR